MMTNRITKSINLEILSEVVLLTGAEGRSRWEVVEEHDTVVDSVKDGDVAVVSFSCMASSVGTVV